jgi:hypothetical protein
MASKAATRDSTKRAAVKRSAHMPPSLDDIQSPTEIMMLDKPSNGRKQTLSGMRK